MSSIQNTFPAAGFPRSCHVTLPFSKVTVWRDLNRNLSVDATQDMCHGLKKIGVDVSFIEELLNGTKSVVEDTKLYGQIMDAALALIKVGVGSSTLVFNSGYSQLIRSAKERFSDSERVFCTLSFPSGFVFKELRGTCLRAILYYDGDEESKKNVDILVADLPSSESFPSMDSFPKWAQNQARKAADSIKDERIRWQVETIAAEGMIARQEFMEEIFGKGSTPRCSSSVSTPRGCSPSPKNWKELPEDTQ